MLDEFRQVLKGIALENGASVVDLQEVFYDAQKTIAPKNLPLTEFTQQILGTKSWQMQLKRALKD